ncbi:guanine deaminase [Lachnospiraceae bacterium]|nr:guanine deaminase [Lachnospiraceae bacterium]
MVKNFVLKGDVLFCSEDRKVHTVPDSFVVCADGKCEGVFTELPEKYKGFPLEDHSGKLIIPGMTDLHVHAPQYTYRGLGMDMELLDWLNENAFPEEAHYEDKEYADKAYSIFTEDLKKSFTTRACIFATLHREATEILMDKLEETGLVTYVGKVNMDRNGSPALSEKDAETAAADTRQWLQYIKGRYQRTMPILTPRFIPSCSDELMKELGVIAEEQGLRVQSHLSENPSEIAWVKELVPASKNYGDAYALFNTLGDEEHPAVMAHCVYTDGEELELLKKHHTYIAHCPDSNLNIASGIAPVRKFLDEGVNIGLGSDVAGGASLSLVQAMVHSIQVSKMYWRHVDQDVKPLQFGDAFYMATLGGGSYFGKTGSFLPGYEFDALVIDDSGLRSMRKLTIQERAERMIYLSGECSIKSKYVSGQKII